jgi:hypothetical protein
MAGVQRYLRELHKLNTSCRGCTYFPGSSKFFFNLPNYSIEDYKTVARRVFISDNVSRICGYIFPEA